MGDPMPALAANRPSVDLAACLQLADFVAEVEKLEAAKIDARAGVRRKRCSRAPPRW